ncbi:MULTISPECIES: glutaredoxin 3 [unclassified Psychrobacter]|uniref:glutaredoxin 3 n=1 Tax=unclassified Psychrobacter TaxID=196806 RepID=UPI0018F5D671|nr:MULTISPECIES: glutaredoxin 3 [unclassified Psychrobacter]
MSVPVKVYTTPICPYCTNAKQLLQSKGVDYEEISMHDMSREDRMELMKKTNNYRTVPQIFVGETFVGGFSELNQMNQQGKLDELLAG